MRIGLSKRIIEYVKKILVIVLLIQTCILSISNSYVRAEGEPSILTAITDSKVNPIPKSGETDKYAYAPDSEEVKAFAKELTNNFYNWTENGSVFPPKWDDLYERLGKKGIAANEFDVPYNDYSTEATEMTMLYLIDLYARTGSEFVQNNSDPNEADKLWDFVSITVTNNAKDPNNAPSVYFFETEDGLKDYSSEVIPLRGDNEDTYDWKEFALVYKDVIPSIDNEIREERAKEKEDEGNAADNGLLDFLDGIAGVLFMGFRIIPVIIGGAISVIMNASSGENITIYNLLFNKVNLTSINFFDRVSGGEANAANVNTIRDNVAIWYVSLRNVAAVILALILIYVAIRMAISTVAEDKAKYKNMLIDWLTSLCLLFVLHYIMVIVINLNNSFVELLDTGSNSNLTSIQDTLLKNSFSTFSFTEGVGNAVAYMMIIGMSLIYFFAYIKRMITIAFLIIIAPLITITYSIDKMGDGKSQALNTWLKEFIYNILIQPFQCIIYLSLVSTVLGMLDDTNLLTVFLAIYVLMFMYQAEEIVKNIFGFKSQSMGKTVAAAAVTGAIISQGTALFKGKGEEKKKPTSGSDYKQRPRTKNAPDTNNGGQNVPSGTGNNGGQNPNGGSGGTGGQMPSVGSGNTGGQMPSVGSGNTGGQNTSGGSGSNGGQQGTGNTANNGQGQNSTNSQNDYIYTPPLTEKEKRMINGVKSFGAKAGKALLRANVNGGLRLAGMALGLSTGKLDSGIAGIALGSAQAGRINRTMKKRELKGDEDVRHCNIANSIDDFQGENMTNTQVMQRAQDWLDGVSMPDRDDSDGLKLYQQLMEEMEIQKDQGKSDDEAREIIDNVIRNSLSGAQSRIPKGSVVDRIRNRFSEQNGTR